MDVMIGLLFVFFKQKTAYEMRISDWSSDVCASDLPNHAILADNLVRLKKARDARGRALEVIELPQPREARHLDGERLALSYVNYYIANGGIVMPSFDDAHDDKARDIVAGAFPGRRVVQVPALAILAGGGGIHCITQQQPRA